MKFDTFCTRLAAGVGSLIVAGIGVACIGVATAAATTAAAPTFVGSTLAGVAAGLAATSLMEKTLFPAAEQLLDYAKTGKWQSLQERNVEKYLGKNSFS